MYPTNADNSVPPAEFGHSNSLSSTPYMAQQRLEERTQPSPYEHSGGNPPTAAAHTYYASGTGPLVQPAQLSSASGGPMPVAHGQPMTQSMGYSQSRPYAGAASPPGAYPSPTSYPRPSSTDMEQSTRSKIDTSQIPSPPVVQTAEQTALDSHGNTYSTNSKENPPLSTSRFVALDESS